MTEDIAPKICPDAYQTLCPYVTVINQRSADLKQVKFALVRADLQDGLVADVQAAVHCGVHFNLFVNATSASMSCLISVFVC